MKKLKFNFDYVGNIKKYLIGSIAIMLIGFIAFAIFGVNMDINFKGGSRFTYTYKGEIDTDDIKEIADKTLDKSTSVSLSSSAGEAGSNKIVISAADIVEADKLNDDKSEKGAHEILEEALQKEFKKNDIKFAESNIVEKTIAKGFYVKSLVAVALAAILVVIYIGFRFRKIGGFSAALFSFVALVHDVLFAFFICVFFRFEIDMNFVAVVMTLFGYSLNDTIVIYDRIRENRRKDRQGDLATVVNLSINQTLARTILTSVTTFASVVIVAVVAEFYGLTTLRSFAIPMAAGLLSGAYSSVCLCGPLWVKWQQKKADKKAKKNADYTKRAK